MPRPSRSWKSPARATSLPRWSSSHVARTSRPNSSATRSPGDSRQHGASWPEPAGTDVHWHRRIEVQGEREHRQLGGHQRHRRRAREAPHRGRIRRRHGDGPVDRQEHRRHPPGDHRRLARADRHRADLPDARGTRRRDRGDDRPALPRHGRAPGQAGRRLHDGSLWRLAGAPAPDDEPRDRHRQPGRVADRQVDDGAPQAKPAVRGVRRPLRHHAAVRRHLEPRRRPATRLDWPTRATTPSSPSSTCSAS